MRAPADPMEFAPGPPLTGNVSVPGDKSISHRALMLAAMAPGRSRIAGLSEAGDVASTASALRAMGVRIERAPDGAWTVDGVGPGNLLQPPAPFDMGNSGTSARLLMGLVASHPIRASFTGDASLCRRPMDRVIAPLRTTGATIEAAPGDRLPLTVAGIFPAAPVRHRLPVASAQVKSALLFAGLNSPGTTEIAELVPTRDHSERLLASFGADIDVQIEANGERQIRLQGPARLTPQSLSIAGDPSSAAFLAVAALIVPGSAIRIAGVGVNPMRIGLFHILQQMGGDLRFENRREVSGEPVADLIVRHSPLRAIDVPPAIAPAMIDEFPIFFVAAAFAQGVSKAHGLAELRVKESDRISAMARGLDAIGVTTEESTDGLAVTGSGGAMLPGGAVIDPQMDHRIAMSFAVAGLGCRQKLIVADMSPVATSYPRFTADLNGLVAI